MAASTNSAGPRATYTPLGPGQFDLSQEYKAILEKFDDICARDGRTLDLKSQAPRGPEAINYKQTLDFLADQRGRLRVWGEDVGANGVDKASLSYRLREAPHIRTLVHELLQNVLELLREG